MEGDLSLTLRLAWSLPSKQWSLTHNTSITWSPCIRNFSADFLPLLSLLKEGLLLRHSAPRPSPSPLRRGSPTRAICSYSGPGPGLIGWSMSNDGSNMEKDAGYDHSGAGLFFTAPFRTHDPTCCSLTELSSAHTAFRRPFLPLLSRSSLVGESLHSRPSELWP